MISLLKHNANFLSFSTIRMLGNVFLFLTPLLVAKLLGPEDFGRYSLSIMVMFFFTAFLIRSSQRPFIVYASKELKEQGVISTAFSARILFLIAGVVFFSIFSLIFLEPFKQFALLSTQEYLFLLSSYVGIGLRFVIETLFLGLQKQRLSALYMLTTGFISFIFILFAHYTGSLSLKLVFISFLVGSGGASIIFLPFIPWKKLLPFHIDASVVKKMLRYTSWMLVGSTAVFLISWGDNFILRYYVSLEQIGQYNFGYQIFKGVIIFLTAIQVFFLPTLAQNIGNKTYIQDFLTRDRPPILGLGIIGILILIVVLPFLITIFYGDIYMPAIHIIQLLLIGAFFALYQSFYTALFDAHERYKFTQITYVIMVVVNLGLDLLLIPIFGITGAAYATVMAYITSALLYTIHFQKNKYDFVTK